MLVRIRDALEAAEAAAAGVDAVELWMQNVSAADVEAARAVRARFPGRLRLRFNGVHFSAEVTRLSALLRADEIAVAVGQTHPSAGVLAQPESPRSIAILPALPADLGVIENLRQSMDGVMLDVGPDHRLIDEAGIAALDAFAAACRASRLPFGLAGGLEAPDVARLLLLEPDMLGFDTGLRRLHHPNEALDPRALDAIRALIPPEGREAAKGAAVTKVIDRVFVRDFAISLAIGAYQAEHGARQRVRFSVVADVVREPTPPRDMRDVFSYDVIIETIRVLSERAHVTFVETLAEEVAASLLAHAEVVAVTVKVEKLDVIAGAVGIEIVRRNAAS